METAAVFNAGGGVTSIALTGPVIAHSLVFNAGATGYSLTAGSGGALTVTAGGITANESVAINSDVTVGAPQTWTTAAGKTLTIGGNLHTVISPLTIDGAGNTVIGGGIDGGGVINSLGAPAGNLIKNGSGALTISGPSVYTGSIAVNAGTVRFAASENLNALTVGDNTTVTLAANAPASGNIDPRHVMGGLVIVTNNLSLGNNGLGKLDLTNNALIWRNAGATGESEVATWIAAGADCNPNTQNPTWDGASGITTSLAAPATGGDPIHYALAYALGSELLSHGTTSVANVTFGPNDVLVMYTVRGDIAFDGCVDDFTSTAEMVYGGQIGGWEQGNFHYGGIVDDFDNTIAMDNVGWSIPTASQAAALIGPAGGADALDGSGGADAIPGPQGAAPGLVPEPMSLATIVLGGLLLSLRKSSRAARVCATR
jgi:autotransporter-associated beta strand protein